MMAHSSSNAALSEVAALEAASQHATGLPSAFDSPSASNPHPNSINARPPRPIVRTSSAPIPHTPRPTPPAALKRRDSMRSLETAAAIDFDIAVGNTISGDLTTTPTDAPHTTKSNNTPMLPAEVLDAVVKISCTHAPPNWQMPWQKRSQHTSGSTGFAISAAINGPESQRWILTNAHSVSYHSQVKVRKRGDDTRYIAHVVAIGRECDIALLAVDDDEFWEGGSGVHPVTFGVMPQLQESVSVVGFPLGGTGLSISAGVTSRIELQHYAHGVCKLLALQIDGTWWSGGGVSG